MLNETREPPLVGHPQELEFKMKYIFMLTVSVFLAAAQAHAKKSDRDGILPSIGMRANELRVDKNGILRYAWGDVAKLVPSEWVDRQYRCRGTAAQNGDASSGRPHAAG